MAISELDRKRIDVWCAARVPASFRDEIRIEAKYRGNSVNIVDRRAPFHPSQGTEWTELRVARITWDPDRNVWKLFARDRNDRLLPYPEEFGVGTTLVEVLDEIDRDPSAMFWG